MFRAGFLLISFALTVFAADSHYQATGNSLPIELPLIRPTLNAEKNPVSFPVQGLSENAQAFFDQAIRATHAFAIFEAERNFREVIRLHPEHSIPYLFAAFSQTVFGSGNTERGLEYLKTAQKLQEKQVITALQRHWFSAVEALYEPALRDKERTYVKRHLSHLRDALAAARDKAAGRETKAFLALNLWNYHIVELPKDSDERLLAKEEVDGLIKDILAEVPSHPVHHYKIHLWDDAKNAVLARESARVSGKSNSQYAHQWHMASHIYSDLGEYRNAAYNFEAAHRTDNHYLQNLNLNANVIHNYAHNLDYFFTVLAASGGVDRALEVAKNILAQPRFFSVDDFNRDPVDYTVVAMMGVLEQQIAWDKAYELVQAGYFDSVLTRNSDVGYQGQILRFKFLACFYTGKEKEARPYLEDLKELRIEYAKLSDAVKSEITLLEKLEKDLRLFLELLEPIKSGSLNRKLLQNYLDLGVTPHHHIALLVGESDKKEALTIVRKMVEETDGQIAPLAVLIHLLLKDGQVDEARREWEYLLPLIHLPQHLDTADSAQTITLPDTAFPFLSRMRRLHPILSTFPAKLSTQSAQHSYRTWLEENPGFEFERLGSLRLKRPTAPLGPNHSLLWVSKKRETTVQVDQLLAEGTSDQKQLLVVFRQSQMCIKCNEAQEKLIQDWADKFAQEGIEILVVYPSDLDPTILKKNNVSYVADPQMEVFKAFGTYDQFKDEPTHGIFFVGAKNKIRWDARLEHAFELWEDLLTETKRLKRLPLYE